MGLRSKPCSEEGCTFPVWSKGKCRAHGEKKPLMKSKVLKSKGFSRKNSSYDKEKMYALFDLHWDTHPDKKCESCGKQLWGENLTIYHDHLLEKSVYPEFMYEIDNLFLVCLDCHTKKPSKPTEKHLEAIEQAKKRFNI